MIREYERHVDKKFAEQTQRMNEKFNEIDKKFDEQAQSIGALLAIVKSLVKEEKIPPHDPNTISE